MFKNDAINEKEMTLIIANLLSVKAIFAFPGTIVETSGNAAWIEVIYMALFAWGLMEISFLTYQISGRKSIIDLSSKIVRQSSTKKEKLY